MSGFYRFFVPVYGNWNTLIKTRNLLILNVLFNLNFKFIYSKMIFEFRVNIGLFRQPRYPLAKYSAYCMRDALFSNRRTCCGAIGDGYPAERTQSFGLPDCHKQSGLFQNNQK
jgi:hypothetical protein